MVVLDIAILNIMCNSYYNLKQMKDIATNLKNNVEQQSILKSWKTKILILNQPYFTIAANSYLWNIYVKNIKKAEI